MVSLKQKKKVSNWTNLLDISIEHKFGFVCLFNWLLHAETHLGLDGTRLEQNAQAMLKSLYKHAGHLVVYRNVKREKQIWRYMYYMKEKKTTATPNKIKLNNLNVSLWAKRKEILYSISTVAEA